MNEHHSRCVTGLGLKDRNVGFINPKLSINTFVSVCVASISVTLL